MATTTPNYGWDVPTSSDYVKLGAVAIETLGDDIDATLWTALGGNYPGLRLVKKQTIGTGVSSVTVTGAFSAIYENYKIAINDFDASTDDNLVFVTVNGTTGSNYNSTRSAINIGTGAFTSGNSAGGTAAILGVTSTANASMSFDVVTPFLTSKTYFTNGSSTGFNFNLNSLGFTLTNNSSTAITITPQSGTLTGGTIYVYGYGAS
jgi:hypothetical protein